jgi:pantoate--beta-alanine ligase
MDARGGPVRSSPRLMRIIRGVRPMTTWARKHRDAGRSIALVPTMGALHDGHRSLIRAARHVADTVVVSIFVNPRQFGPREDYAKYPRTLRQDFSVCKEEDVDVVFVPSVDEIYPRSFQTVVSVKGLTRTFEGRSRPGHFEGVTTVVSKLLHIIQPHKIFLGQKDYQQVIVVTQMVKDLNVPVSVTMRPTIREHDGLALSSRNRLLSRSERKAAAVLFRALSAGNKLIRHGERSGKKVKAEMLRVIRGEPLAWLEYAAVVHRETLYELATLHDRVVLLLAVWIGKTRLIDNIVVTCR